VPDRYHDEEQELKPPTTASPTVSATSGGSVYSTRRRTDTDPTQNVLDLVHAAVTRLDDLRTLESAHIREVAEIRFTHAREMRQAEALRLDAIRAVDVGAVNRAAEVATTQAATLAAQVATSAETLRTQVAAAASAATIALAAALEPVQKDIADLRRAQYEAQGQKTQVVETRAGGASTGMWVGVGISVLVLLLSVIGVVMTLVITH
jgi:hypothetical protein